MSARNDRASPRYRVVCYERAPEGERVLMDATGEGFIAAVGTISAVRMAGEIGRGGPTDVQEHIALLIARDSGVADLPFARRTSPR